MVEREQRTTCADCGREATGWAYVGDDRYCHGDEDRPPTCFQRAQARIPGNGALRHLIERLDELEDRWCR